MSEERSNGNGRERREDLTAARSRADLISGLRGLSRRRAAPPAPASAAPPAGRLPEGAGGRTDSGSEAEERCELCGTVLAPDHRHLLHLGERRMLCACETCWSVRSGEASYRPAGVRVRWMDDLDLPDEAWASFGVPIGLAFFLATGDPRRVVAFYPSPAGATESEIDDAAWGKLVGLNPALEDLEPDCEALIVNRLSDPNQHVIAPIDECYRLVGMIKASWEGISGGTGPQDAIERFFIELRIKDLRSSRG